MTVVQCYAPTNDASDVDKAHFYEVLHGITTAVPKHDMFVVLGDMNAKIGADNKGYENLMGTNGCGEMNENGFLFAEVCQTQNLVIGGSIFPLKDIHKLMWTSPNGVTKNQIDHITVDGRFRRSLKDVKLRRGADVSSDHELVANIQLKLCRQSMEKSGRKRYDVDKLRVYETAQEFNIKDKINATKSERLKTILKNKYRAKRQIS